MKTTILLMAGGYGVYATAHALHPTAVNLVGDGPTLTPQHNFNGWVNPEDLTSMPQCIAQQDHSTWLDAMTECTRQRCTSWFTFICTHHQWLTELSCLSEGFSPDVVRDYLPYCDRSVLAEAQLYQWIRNITGRPWLVEVGDAHEVQHLSPSSLTSGYADMDVAYNAPRCLTDSLSILSMEPFQHVMASCQFTSTAQHTGNAARPWEYSASSRSMIALDSETAGYYDLTQRSIQQGDYFDKDCFCSTFNIDPENEPCSDSGGLLDLTKERLWINATCGPTTLPEDWTGALRTTQYEFIPKEDWQWPQCVVDMPKDVVKLTDQCQTDACELDSNGYCIVTRAIDRACFCRDVSYDSCSASCHVFETRMDYVNWLHDLCRDVPDWDGLPDDWRQLAVPTPQDMIPWQWTVTSSDDSNVGPTVSYEWRLGSVAFINLAAFLAAFLTLRTERHRVANSSIPKGPLIAALIATIQLLTNWFNATIVQKTLGYAGVSVFQLLLLWTTLPRPTWFAAFMIGMQPSEWRNTSAAKSFILAEWILQGVSSYYMATAVGYGLQHGFYFGALQGVEMGTSARIMYAGAAMWLAVSGLVVIKTVRASQRSSEEPGSLDMPKWERNSRAAPTQSDRQTGHPGQYRPTKSKSSEYTPLTNHHSGRVEYVEYGTVSIEREDQGCAQNAVMGLRVPSVVPMLLLWIAQWLFWGGYLRLSSEEFCLPHLGVLTAVWSVSSVVSVAVATTWQ